MAKIVPYSTKKTKVKIRLKARTITLATGATVTVGWYKSPSRNGAISVKHILEMPQADGTRTRLEFDSSMEACRAMASLYVSLDIPNMLFKQENRNS